jgi:hypothetical protein
MEIGNLSATNTIKATKAIKTKKVRNGTITAKTYVFRHLLAFHSFLAYTRSS